MSAIITGTFKHVFKHFCQIELLTENPTVNLGCNIIYPFRGINFSAKQFKSPLINSREWVDQRQNFTNYTKKWLWPWSWGKPAKTCTLHMFSVWLTFLSIIFNFFQLVLETQHTLYITYWIHNDCDLDPSKLEPAHCTLSHNGYHFCKSVSVTFNSRDTEQTWKI